MTTELVKATSWSEEQSKLIDLYQQKGGQTRSNAIRKMRLLEGRGVTPAQQIENLAKPAPAKKPLHQPDELNAKLAELGDKAPHVAAAKTKKAATAKSDKPKKERKSAVPYEKRHAAGLCVKCPRPAPSEGTVCAYCRELAKYFGECKAEKREYSKKSFDRSQRGQDANALAMKGKVAARPVDSANEAK